MCCGDQQCNSSVLSLGSGTAWQGTGISVTFIPLGSSFWLSMASPCACSPGPSWNEPPCWSQLSLAWGRAWAWFGMGPKLVLVLGNLRELKQNKSLLDSYFLPFSLVISYCANCYYLLLEKINTLTNMTNLTNQRWWRTEVLKERIVLKIFLEFTARLLTSVSSAGNILFSVVVLDVRYRK